MEKFTAYYYYYGATDSGLTINSILIYKTSHPLLKLAL